MFRYTLIFFLFDLWLSVFICLTTAVLGAGRKGWGKRKDKKVKGQEDVQ